MSEIGKALWATELADIPMPESATYADFHQLVAEKQRYEARRDQLRFIQSLQRIAAQRPELKQPISAYIEEALEAGL